jgi:voltage-gated potassium channel
MRKELPEALPRPRRIPFSRVVYVVRQVWPALRLIITGVVALVVLAAVLERIVEPEVFTSLGLALWWSVVTVATVGYGDVVPESAPGRFVGVVVMLFGMAWVPVVTTLVVTALSRPSIEEDARHAELAAKLDQLHQRLERLEGPHDDA